MPRNVVSLFSMEDPPQKKPGANTAESKPRQALPKALQDNLWKKGGPSPNPSGRPKKLPITEAYAKLAEKPVPEVIRVSMNKKLRHEVLHKGATWSQANALAQFINAIAKANVRAASEIADRLEGKARQTIDVLHSPEDPLTQLLEEFRKQSPAEAEPEAAPSSPQDNASGTKSNET